MSLRRGNISRLGRRKKNRLKRRNRTRDRYNEEELMWVRERWIPGDLGFRARWEFSAICLNLITLYWIFLYQVYGDFLSLYLSKPLAAAYPHFVPPPPPFLSGGLLLQSHFGRGAGECAVQLQVVSSFVRSLALQRRSLCYFMLGNRRSYRRTAAERGETKY